MELDLTGIGQNKFFRDEGRSESGLAELVELVAGETDQDTALADSTIPDGYQLDLLGSCLILAHVLVSLYILYQFIYIIGDYLCHFRIYLASEYDLNIFRQFIYLSIYLLRLLYKCIYVCMVVKYG